MRKVFVILLNWNNWHETRECLESLKEINYSNVEVLIVDNGSSEETRNEVKRFVTDGLGFKIKILWNSTNLGFAGGNNVGIKYALEHGADYILLLNNDTVVAPDFLTELVKVAESDSSFGILGARIYKYGTDELVFDGGKISRCMTTGEHAKYPYFAKASQGTQILNIKYPIIDYITGAAFLIKRQVIERIGLMREEYFLYYEDVDWCIRARYAGYKCVLVPTSKVWHKVSATNKEGSPSYIYYHTRNGLMLAKLNGNTFQKVSAYLIGLWILSKQFLKLFFMPSKRIWAKAMTRGVLDFYRGKVGKYPYY